MRCGRGVILALLALVSTATAQTKPISEQAASTAMTALWRDAARNESGYPNRWTYEHGLVLKGIERVWAKTHKKEYLDFIQQNIDHFVADDGSIRTYSTDNYNIDKHSSRSQSPISLQNHRQRKIPQSRYAPA